MNQKKSKPTVLITGASSGFGRAMAIKYHQNGHRLVLTARRFERLEQLKTELGDDPAIYIARVDVSDKASIDTFIAALPVDFKNIGILINNAGLALGVSDFANSDERDFDTMIDTNIKGLIYMSKRVLPLMLAHRSGHIVNIGSIAASWPYPGGNVYCTSKAFVQQFSRTLRCDLVGKNIRVSNIEPGLAETEFSVVRFKGDETKAKKLYADRAPLIAEDIAEIVYFTTSLPGHVNINNIEVMPTCQSWAAFHIE
ncbi:MAG: SDR family NAD(P)-dependent oxidoreductase [Francisellaceae bacterium]